MLIDLLKKCLIFVPESNARKVRKSRLISSLMTGIQEANITPEDRDSGV